MDQAKAPKLSGKLFSEFIENKFLELFKSSCTPTADVFVQDGDPSQNCKAAKTALDKIGAVQFTIPLRSPDLHPIENALNLVEKKSNSDAVKYSISKESYAKFVERVENTLLRYPIEPIDNITGYTEQGSSFEILKTSLVTFFKNIVIQVLQE